jgi:hypothetical protein
MSRTKLGAPPQNTFGALKSTTHQVIDGRRARGKGDRDQYACRLAPEVFAEFEKERFKMQGENTDTLVTRDVFLVELLRFYQSHKEGSETGLAVLGQFAQGVPTEADKEAGRTRPIMAWATQDVVDFFNERRKTNNWDMGEVLEDAATHTWNATQSASSKHDGE